MEEQGVPAIAVVTSPFRNTGEAMAASCPVVLGVKGEARQLLEESGGGVAVTPGDAADLASTLASLAADPERRRRLGTSGRRFVTARFTHDALARAYLDEVSKIRRPAG